MLELRLKEIRLELKITQKELARRSGFSQTYISRLETDKNMNPTLELVTSLATSMNVCPLRLLYHRNNSCINCKN